LVSNGYFETLDIPLRKGRLLQASDLQPGAPYVVVMNATLARQSFGDVDPIGQYVTGWNGDGETIWREVVGVVGDVRAFGREREAPAELFFPYSQAPSGSWTAFQRNGITLLARAGVGGEAVSSMRAAVRTVDAAIPLFDVRNMNEVITLTTAGRRFNMLLLSLLGITGVLLAAVGIYGVVAFFVLQRTHEIGVRMALGATTRDVVRLVMGHSARLTVLGLTTGALGAIAVTRVLTSLLFEIEARDPLTFVAGAGVLATVALAAALLPAHRATRVHPVQSLAVGQ
jgi:hypothetical protein